MQRGVNLTDTEVYLLVLSVPVCGIVNMSAQLLFWISLPAVGLANQRFIESAPVNNRVVRWDSKTECSDPIVDRRCRFGRVDGL